MKEEDIKKLLARYKSGNCTEEEKAVLESWYLQAEGGDFDLSDKELELIKDNSWQNIVNPLKLRYRRKVPSWIQYAAAIFIFSTFSLVFFFYFHKSSDRELIEQELLVEKNDLIPGGNKATLTLADGTEVSLSESANGVIAHVEGMEINKTADGQIVYKITNLVSLEKGNAPKYNKITTPRGGQYQIILPDGTKVWLNAASSLKYPEQFNDKVRHVELLGEAYFEVNDQRAVSGEKVPFIVGTPTQSVEVLGTHFNINSYEDEEIVKTTLLEGSVRVSINSSIGQKNEVVLKPNQQSMVNGDNLDVIKVGAEESITWKNGYFNFEHANIESVMRQLSRWYDVDIVFSGNIPKGTFTGKVYRNMNITKVLEVLEFAQVDFKIEGKRMIIFS